MAGWKLEVFRMTLYVAFPVGMFVIFNYPPFYEQAILDGRRAMAAAYDPKAAEMLRKHVEEMKAKQMAETLDELKKRESS
jgi:protein PET100